MLPLSVRKVFGKIAMAGCGFALTAGWCSQDARAGLFTTSHFVLPGEFSIGFEPELTLTHGSGMGANLRYTQGVNELLNITGLIGTSAGPRKFRAGGNLVFDFFPDIEGQPGIGIAAQGIYYRLADAGLFEVTGIPYIHKVVKSGNEEIEPFAGLPLGMNFSEGRYQATSSVVLGAMFKGSEHIRYSLEFGIAINNSESYFSGGIAYYH